MRGSPLAVKPGDATHRRWVNLPDDHHGARLVGVVRDLRVAGRVEAVVGDDVDAVSGQDLTVGVLVAGAGVDARVGQLQALNQQSSLHVDGAVIVVARRELGTRGDEKQLEDVTEHFYYSFSSLIFETIFLQSCTHQPQNLTPYQQIIHLQTLSASSHKPSFE